MSHVSNDLFLENSYQRFHEAIETGDSTKAEAIISDLRAFGFNRHADTLMEGVCSDCFNTGIVVEGEFDQLNYKSCLCKHDLDR